ncbi:PaaI family thioesterase [Methylobacterium sp. JK268]
MPPSPVMTREAVTAFLAEVFPQIHLYGPGPEIEAVGPLTATLRMPYHERHLRPGGTISGPTMMALADLALYAAILANLGPVALAVTTNLSFNFMRKPAQRDLTAEARLMKLGRQLAVGEVLIRCLGEEDLVCHATGTYAIPPRRE